MILYFDNILNVLTCIFRGVFAALRIETRFDYKSNEQSHRRNRRMHFNAKHVQPRRVCQHTRKFSLFVRQWLCIRR